MIYNGWRSLTRSSVLLYIPINKHIEIINNLSPDQEEVHATAPPVNKAECPAKESEDIRYPSFFSIEIDAPDKPLQHNKTEIMHAEQLERATPGGLSGSTATKPKYAGRLRQSTAEDSDSD